MKQVFSATLVACLTVVSSAVAAAQERWPVSLEANLGIGTGRSSGEYRDNATGLVGDVLVGFRVRSAGSGALFTAATIGVQGTGIATDICLPASTGGCVQRFPEFTVVSLLGGWETGSAALRFLSGPAAARAYGDWDVVRFAWLGRVDAALGIVGRVSASASLRAFVVPSYDRESFQLLALGFGVRIR